MTDRIIAYGHPNVTGRHRTTLELTKDREMTIKGDCIIGVSSDKSIRDLSEEFKGKARKNGSMIELTLKVGGLVERITGEGHPDLTFGHDTDIVVRKSDYICSRTIMIRADKSARELDKEILKRLKNPKEKIEAQINVL